ncbi:MAG: hypothetical protein JWQ35_2142 [Bacteriovoracaceae bacterium]|nr:hypothetical protein [Bacteriovoracaceae bacterium]
MIAISTDDIKIFRTFVFCFLGFYASNLSATRHELKTLKPCIRNLAFIGVDSQIERNLEEKFPSITMSIVQRGNFPGIKQEKHLNHYLLETFPSFSTERKALGIAGVWLGERKYRMAREKARLHHLPLHLAMLPDGQIHPYWEIGVQAFVVSAAHESRHQIAAVSAAMAYLLHDLDDLGDQFYAGFLNHLNWEEIVGAKSATSFLKCYYPPGYEQLYRNVMTEVFRSIPDFDLLEFEKGTLRMIMGGVLLSPRVPYNMRVKFRAINKNAHVIRLNKHLRIKNYLKNDVSDLFYAYSVKSLADAILSFHGPKIDRALSVILGIRAAPGLLLENIDKEISTGEIDARDRLTSVELLKVLEGANREFIMAIKNGEFEVQQLQIVEKILTAYGDAFKDILKKGGLWKEHIGFMIQFHMAIEQMTSKSGVN